jgi:hypothetical protein
MSRLGRILLLAAFALAVVPATADAAPTRHLERQLTSLWTTVLETPDAQNAFGHGGADFACWDIGRHTVAPFAPTSADTCTVGAGTKVFIVGFSVECSTFEGNGTTDAELRACARAGDLQAAPRIAVDGRVIHVAEVETPLLHITLPPDNLFGLPAGTPGLSVGHGWVALHHPLAPGVHKIEIGDDVVTEIIVRRGR